MNELLGKLRHVCSGRGKLAYTGSMSIHKVVEELRWKKNLLSSLLAKGLGTDGRMEGDPGHLPWPRDRVSRTSSLPGSCSSLLS